MKKLISIFLAAVILMVSLGCSFIVFAANSVSVDSFVESVGELNAEEAEEEKTIEESVGSRVIVKATVQPETFGNAMCIKGTYGKYIYQYDTEDEALEAVEYYSSLGTVKWAERDQLLEAKEVPFGTAMLGTKRAEEVITNREIPTSSVKVGIIDTGIDFTHDIFKDNCRVVDSGLNVTDSGTDNSALDDFGHGSEVAEIVMDNTTDDVTIIGYKVLNKKGSGTDLWIATGIERAVEDGVDIINLSLGGELYPFNKETSEVFVEAVEFALSKGVIVVGAAGNEGRGTEHYVPSSIEGVITVGAIDKAGNHSYFSNFGKEVDFVAPGEDLSVDYTNELISGTSFAAPYIASEVALVKSVFPDASVDNVKNKLSSVCVPYEHLTYHDGFHAIKEDRGMEYPTVYGHEMKMFHDADSPTLYYGNGMPQVDLIFRFSDGYLRTEAPSFSVDSGHYVDEEFDLEISSPEAEIYYTQDEAYPTKENAIKYDGAIHLDELQSFRAVAFSEGKAPSYFSAREYRMEYHALESEFTFKKEVVYTDVFGRQTKYNNVIFYYSGRRKNIIFPTTYNGMPVETVGLTAHYVDFTSLTIPDCIHYAYGSGTDRKRKIVIFTGNGLVGFSCDGGEYGWENLVEINTASAKSVWANHSLVRTINAPNATYLDCKYSPYLKSIYAPKLNRVDENGFSHCFSLHDIYCPELKYIRKWAFSYCCKLTNYNFESVEKIDASGLDFCFQIKSLYLPNLTSVDGKFLLGSGVVTLYAPKLKELQAMPSSFFFSVTECWFYRKVDCIFEI